jgi:hypothetical protein
MKSLEIMHRSIVVFVLATALGGSGCGNPRAAPADAAQADAQTEYSSPPDGNGALMPTPGFPGRSQPLGSAKEMAYLRTAAGESSSLAPSPEAPVAGRLDQRTPGAGEGRYPRAHSRR